MARHLNHRSIAVILVCTLLKISLADVDSVKQDVCKDITPDSSINAKNEFTLDSHFKVKVEGVIPSLGRIIRADMFYKILEKTLRVNILSGDWNIHAFHEYNTHQTLRYSFPGGLPRDCKVDNDMRGHDGFYLIPHNVKDAAKLQPSDLFRLSGPSGFGDDDIVLQNLDDVVFRSLTCKQYVSCQKVIDENGDVMVMKVTHLVSSTKFTKAEDGTVPIQIKFEGKYASGSKEGDDVTFVYNLYHYRTIVRRKEMEFPLGAVCEGRKSDKSFPKIPPYLSFGQEIHFPKSTTKIQTVRTIYDKELHFVKETYFNEDGTKKETRVDDFNTGLSYTVQEKDLSCVVKNIGDASNINDFVQESDGTIQMITPEQLFHSGGVEFHYNGKHWFRNIETEVWTGKDKKNGHIYSWFFVSNIKDIDTKELQRIPFKRMIWEDEKSAPTSTYFYNVVYTTPDTLNDFIGNNCFESGASVYISLPGLQREQIKGQKTYVERNVRSLLSSALTVPQVGIYARLFFPEGSGMISLRLSGRPKIEGGDKASAEQAIATLKRKLEDGTLVFNIGKQGASIDYKGEALVSPFLYEVDHSDSEDESHGYSTGALAGLAIAMTVVGLLAGGAAGFWFFIKRA